MIATLVAFLRLLAGWLFTLGCGAATCLLALVMGPERAWLQVRLAWGRGAAFLVGTQLDIEGAENLQRPAVFVSNHESLIDVVLLPAILPRTVKFLAKKELRRIPLWGWGFAATGAILIDRQDPRGAVASIREALKTLPRGWSVMVFPEGTRSLDGQMRPFKKGAFHMAMQAGLPVVPIGLCGARDIVRKDGWLIRPGKVYVTVGKPISSAAWRPETVDDHAAQCREAVLQCANRAKARRERPSLVGSPARAYNQGRSTT